MKLAWALAAVLAASWCGIAAADEPPPAAPAEAAAPEAASPAPPPAVPTAPAGTVVLIQVTQAISSKTAKAGDKFTLQLAAPIVADGQVLVPAGVSGMGEVISASPAAKMGRAGELVLAARYLDADGRRIGLKAFKVGGTGQSESEGLFIASMVAPLPGLIIGLNTSGGEMEVPVGMAANAKLSADVTAAPVP